MSRHAFVTALTAIMSTSVLAAVITGEPPMVLYSSASPKLRIQTDQPTFAGVLEKDIELKFTPSLKNTAYNLSIASDTVLTLTLNPGKKWANPSTISGMTLYLTELRFDGGENLLENTARLAVVIPTPTILRGKNNLIYMTGTSNFVISGTNFREKGMALVFEPPLERNKDYTLSVKSDTTMELTRMSNAKWRDDPGPLKLRRIDTGAGALPVDPAYGGIVVAEVQANLGTHGGVTVASTPDERFYQDTGELVILGTGFNETHSTLRFANGIRGNGVNYTTLEHTKELIRMKLSEGSKWRSNPANLPGPLILLAVDAGGGFVPVGPTEAKKGCTVATIFETPSIVAREDPIHQTHTHEIWIKGAGFTRQSYTSTYTTTVVFEPPLDSSGDDPDVNVEVLGPTLMKVTLKEGKKWVKFGTHGQEVPLKVASVDCGAGTYKLGTTVAKVHSDADDHPSRVTATRSAQALDQAAAIQQLAVTGHGLTDKTRSTLSPPLEKGAGDTAQVQDETKSVVSLRKHQKWRDEGGALSVKIVDTGRQEERQSYGGFESRGRASSKTPQIEDSERKMLASHTKRLAIALEGTELTLNQALGRGGLTVSGEV